mmetsp:Transcript_39699/g.63681  ORF Transcript_39699/g.63681 Transcript_39699/m.63681 type:complete len:92 (+) Transcript_39699:418-693(+)
MNCRVFKYPLVNARPIIKQIGYVTLVKMDGIIDSPTCTTLQRRNSGTKTIRAMERGSSDPIGTARYFAKLRPIKSKKLKSKKHVIGTNRSP